MKTGFTTCGQGIIIHIYQTPVCLRMDLQEQMVLQRVLRVQEIPQITLTKIFVKIIAFKYANRDGCRIVEIDLNKLPSNVNIYDLSTVSGRNTYLKGITAKNFAAKSSEVLLEGYTLSEAVSLHKKWRRIW